MRILPIILLLLQDPTPPPAPSAEVTATITATKDGGLTILDATKSVGAKGYTWEIAPKGTRGFLVVDGGKRAVFAPGAPGNYTIVLAVAGADGQVDIAIESIGGGPAPPPTPDTLETLVVQWAELVTSPTKKADAEKLANSFATVASQLAAGAIDNDPEKILAATKSSYELALGASLTAWRPWLDKLGEWMDANDSGAYVETWNAIAAGLRGVQ